MDGETVMESGKVLELTSSEYLTSSAGKRQNPASRNVGRSFKERFGMGISETRAINPIGKVDWAETGVEPDVKVRAADALKTALKLAAGRLEAKK